MIPNILHYVHLSSTGREWKLHHHLSVKSAQVRSGVDKIFMWVDQEPHGDWWPQTKDMVELVFVQPPTEIFGKPITQPAHKSDVIRLQILIENGGIYVDTDTIFVKSFIDISDKQFVMGQRGVDGSEGLCPAVILSEKNSVFGEHWLAGFEQSFEGGPPGSDTWCTHSVYYPRWLSKKIPQHITILDYESFFWPLYHTDHMKQLFEESHQFPNALSHHLWESSGKEYLSNLTIQDINQKDTTFNLMVRDLL